jgi:hypothetical protein
MNIRKDCLLYFINSLNAAVHVFPVKKEEKEKEKRSNTLA